MDLSIFDFLIGYFMVGFVAGIIAGTIEKLLGGELKDPAFWATMSCMIWPIAFPLHIFLTLFSVIFGRR